MNRKPDPHVINRIALMHAPVRARVRMIEEYRAECKARGAWSQPQQSTMGCEILAGMAFCFMMFAITIAVLGL